MVVRASGSDGYNDYMYNQLGVGVNSVETIVFHNASASSNPVIHQKIQNAEAIWFAGGDQWDYISYWQNTPVATLIADAIENKNVMIGGTSAGMAILGGYYFSAENGTVASSQALSNPFHPNATVAENNLFEVPFLSETITDTHYDNPDRKGRHSTFLAKMLMNDGVSAKGIACDEYTAVCINPNGIAKVYGQHPTYDDNAYFIQINCEIENNLPEVYASGQPLTWNQNNQALKVYQVKGTSSGSNTFDLNDWETGSGGNWHNWYITSGNLNEVSGNPINCSSLSSENFTAETFQLYPNPAKDFIEITSRSEELETLSIELFTIGGKAIQIETNTKQNSIRLSVVHLSSGIYFAKISNGKNSLMKKVIVR